MGNETRNETKRHKANATHQSSLLFLFRSVVLLLLFDAFPSLFLSYRLSSHPSLSRRRRRRSYFDPPPHPTISESLPTFSHTIKQHLTCLLPLPTHILCPPPPPTLAPCVCRIKQERVPAKATAKKHDKSTNGFALLHFFLFCFCLLRTQMLWSLVSSPSYPPSQPRLDENPTVHHNERPRHKRPRPRSQEEGDARHVLCRADAVAAVVCW